MELQTAPLRRKSPVLRAQVLEAKNRWVRAPIVSCDLPVVSHCLSSAYLLPLNFLIIVVGH